MLVNLSSSLCRIGMSFIHTNDSLVKTHATSQPFKIDNVPSVTKRCQQSTCLQHFDKSNTSPSQSWQELASMEQFEETPKVIILLTYLSFLVFIVIGHVRDLMQSLGLSTNHTNR